MMIYRKPALRRPNQPRIQTKPQIQKPLPPNYVCYRCGQKGKKKKLLFVFCQNKKKIISFSNYFYFI